MSFWAEDSGGSSDPRLDDQPTPCRPVADGANLERDLARHFSRPPISAKEGAGCLRRYSCDAACLCLANGRLLLEDAKHNPQEAFLTSIKTSFPPATDRNKLQGLRFCGCRPEEEAARFRAIVAIFTVMIVGGDHVPGYAAE